jgi:hypothetical protein
LLFRGANNTQTGQGEKQPDMMEAAIQDSILYKLPRELRDAIYEFCFAGTLFNIDRQWEDKYDFDDSDEDLVQPDILEKSLPQKVPLLSVCRILREKALPIFFQRTCFVFNHWKDLIMFQSDLSRWPKMIRSKISILRFCEPVGNKKANNFPQYFSYGHLISACENLSELQIVLNNYLLFPRAADESWRSDPQDFFWDEEAQWIIENYMINVTAHWQVENVKFILLDRWESEDQMRELFNDWKAGDWATWDNTKIYPIMSSDYPEF